jgi:hypothetical protein
MRQEAPYPKKTFPKGVPGNGLVRKLTVPASLFWHDGPTVDAGRSSSRTESSQGRNMDKECAMPFFQEKDAEPVAAPSAAMAIPSCPSVLRNETVQDRHNSLPGVAKVLDAPSLLGPLPAFDRRGVAILHTDLWRRRHAIAS